MSSNGTDHAPATFVARPLSGLQSAGISGRQPRVSCSGEALHVRDEHGACLEIRAANVRRLRLGMVGTRFGKLHMARVYIEGGNAAQPLLLQPENLHDRGYAPVMRSFAHAVATSRGLTALEHGLGDGDGRGLFLWILAVAVGASALALTVWADRFGAVGTALFLLLMAAVVALVGWESLFLHRPATLGSIDEVDRYLPAHR